MADFWNGLTAEEQVALIGLVGGVIVAVVIGILKRAWPDFADTDGRIKQLVVLLIGLVISVAVGEITLVAGVTAAALAIYNLWRTWVAEPLANRKAARLIADDREAGDVE